MAPTDASNLNYAAVISIGSELTRGQTRDLHGKYLSAFLTQAGFTVQHVCQLPDTPDIQAEIDRLSRRHQCIVVTGGLGPTSDDITRETIAACAHADLVFHPELWDDIRARFHAHAPSITNRKQAMLPEGFCAISNSQGTAPGFWGKLNSSLLVALPGPPGELKAMVEESLMPILAENFGLSKSEHLVATSFLIPESALEEGFQAIVSDDITWSTRAEPERIVFSLHGGTAPEREACFGAIERRFGPLCIRRGEISAHEALFTALKEKDWILATAESCTGGLIAKMLTDIPGSSSVFWGTFVTYANEAKEKLLGVTAYREKGAVSAETAEQMANGALERSGADISIAVTGIAGPEGGTPEKPVGTVYICIASRHTEPGTWKLSLAGTRPGIRSRAARCAVLFAEAYIRELRVDKDPVWGYI